MWARFRMWGFIARAVNCTNLDHGKNEAERSEANVMNGEPSRRDFLALTGAALAGAAALDAYQSPKKLYAFVSSWTKGPFGAGGGGGISVFTVNTSDGSLTQVSRTGQDFDGLNGGNLCISADGRFLYCTHEAPNLNGKAGAGGGVHSFAINRENGSLTHLNVQPSMGVNPCFIIVDKTGSRVLVANHGDLVKAVKVVKRNGVPVIENSTDDGTVAMFAVQPDGSLEPACDVAVFEPRPTTEPGAGAAATWARITSTFFPSTPDRVLWWANPFRRRATKHPGIPCFIRVRRTSSSPMKGRPASRLSISIPTRARYGSFRRFRPYRLVIRGPASHRPIFACTPTESSSTGATAGTTVSQFSRSTKRTGR